MEKKKWLTTEYPEIIFEDNTVGRLKKEVWDAPKEEIDGTLGSLSILRLLRGLLSLATGTYSCTKYVSKQSSQDWK